MYNYNNIHLHPACSARELCRISQQRNPVIETDKNVEKLTTLTEKNQKIADKQFKIALIVSIFAALFAAGSFIMALLK